MEDTPSSEFDPHAFLQTYKIPLIIGAIGIFLVFLGIILTIRTQRSSVEFISDTSTASGQMRQITVDVSGAVVNPGVYTLSGDSRVSDAIAIAGGFTKEADSEWISKSLNRASKLSDGAKLYIPRTGEIPTSSTHFGLLTTGSTSNQVLTSSTISINSASQSELEILERIGPVTAKKIIDNRPYSVIEELVSKKVVSQSVFDKIKEKITIY